MPRVLRTMPLIACACIHQAALPQRRRARRVVDPARALGDFDGTWHLWPVVLPSPAPGDEEGDAIDAADEANECCVCFDRRINTRLQPCGHVALCHACAARLASSRCPLCRAQIVDVLRV